MAAVELESALLAPRDGARVLDQVARLARLGPFGLRSLPALALRDRYYDTAGADLLAHGLALRVRDSGDRRVVGLKGEGRRSRGGFERPEHERPWSASAPERIGELLRDAGVPFGRPVDADAGGDDPAVVLGRLGLSLVGDLETHRRRRLLVGGDGCPRAELDIDEVSYRVGGAIATLHEVEIEAIDPGFDLADATAHLLGRVPLLVAWPHNKLAVGIAIARALAERALSPAPDGTISPHGYEALERALEVMTRAPGRSR